MDPLRHVAAVPARWDVVEAALDLVVVLAQRGVGSDGASVSLRRQGRLITVAASDDTVNTLDRHQYESGQGPCVDASREGHPFHIESVADEHRWPAFTPRALEQGINSILSMPVTSDGDSVGSLNLYARLDHAFAAQHELAATFAAAASTVAAFDAPTLSDDEIATRLRRSLQAREVIAQAQGVLMGQQGLTAGQAHRLLREYSQTTSQPLLECARQVLMQAEGRKRSP